MNTLVADLRSDTVTKPSPDMRKALAAADVGDDVLGDDPTVIALQRRAAELLGHDAALLVPSGTMANAIAIRTHTQPGDEIIAQAESHFYYYEAAGFAAMSGCSTRMIQGRRGLFTPEEIDPLIRPPDVHFARSRLLILENTHNRGGGTIWPLEQLDAVIARARQHNLAVHIDGARLMNAAVALGVPPARLAAHADSVAMCFSKGLGAPVGSILAGSADFIARADRYRKMFGGTMRQSGLLAAAALYALDHNVARLAEDHDNAKHLARALAEIPGLSLNPDDVQTNMVFFEVDPAWGSAETLYRTLEARGVRTFDVGPQRMRAVTHLDVSRTQIDDALDVITNVMATPAEVSAR